MAIRKFDAVAEALARKTVLKVEIRRLRRQAREEVRAMKKAGVRLRDEKTLDRNIRDDQWLLEHQANIRRAVQKGGVITLREAHGFDQGIYIDYDVYMQAKEGVASYNRKVDAWNARHAKEIKAGVLEKRRHKTFSVAQRIEETQETADVWFDYTNKYYTPTSSYGQGKWADYITSIMKAVTRRCPVGMDWIIEFFDRMLPVRVPESGKGVNGEYFNFEDYYVTSRTDVVEGYRKLAQHYGLAQEWHDLVVQHRKELDIM